MAKLSSRDRTGIGAREKVIEYLRDHPMPQGALANIAVDHFIKWLTTEGYVITAQAHKAPARRGTPKYTGPSVIGSSHTANLLR